MGDYAGSFREFDLVLIGHNVPHERTCDSSYTRPDGKFTGHAMVLQFQGDFLGSDFFRAPENRSLASFLKTSARGCLIKGEEKDDIIDLMIQMKSASGTTRLFLLMEIFGIFSRLEDYQLLASTAYMNRGPREEHGSMRRVMEFLVLNFQREIRASELYDLTCMKHGKLSQEFTRVSGMSVSEYLNRMRIGFACSLLEKGGVRINDVASQSGFKTLSNFNRQFKRIKGITPRDYSTSRYSSPVFDFGSIGRFIEI